jgi:cation diffusion facilitator family transporter
LEVARSREKQKAASSSLAVAIALTTMKAIVGILTNSLGIISEALHSGLDLVAAATTVYAVRVSDRPPDADHHYGHGKYESFSALVEVLLLLVTCVWISYEAMQRLFFRQALIQVNLAAFIVMGISIVLDFSRSRILYRAAKKYGSQALEADALHFSTDIMSSSVVVLGLFFVTFGFRVADPIAAIGVVVVVVALSLRLGRRTVAVLLDRAPEGLAETIHAAVSKIPGVSSPSHIRVRPSGAQTFIDLQVSVDRSVSFERVNAIVVEVEHAIKTLVPNSDIVVRTQPTALSERKFADEVKSIASQIQGVEGVHDIGIHDSEKGLHVEMHLEVDANASLESAHETASRLEAAIKSSIPGIGEVVTHIESADEEQLIRADVTKESRELVRTIRKTTLGISGVKKCRDVEVHSAEDGLHLTITCVLEKSLSVSDAHDISTHIEEALRRNIDGIAKVLVHVEPDSDVDVKRY